MKKIKQSIAAIFVISQLFSCTSPADAAKEVCDCISKTVKSKNTSEMTGNASECQELQVKYSKKFEGADQNEYSRKIAECTMGSMQIR